MGADPNARAAGDRREAQVPLIPQLLFNHSCRPKKGLAWLLARGDGVAFVILSAKYDPFIATAYMRRGAFAKMNRRGWAIFLGSWLLANLIWIAVCAGGVEAARAVVDHFL